MDSLRPPPPCSFEGNLSHWWKTWEKHFNFFLTATESDSKSDKIKTSILLTCIGPKGREIYETFSFQQENDKLKLKLKIVLEKFSEYCNPRRNITILHHQFFAHKQDEGQSFNDFVTDLKKRASECEFGTLTDSLTKDMIVCGVADHALRERLLRDADLTLAKAIDAGIAAEETKRHTKELEKHQSEVHQVRHQKEKRIKESKTPDMIKKCKFCNGSHLHGVCPAYGKRCRNCNRRNHFAVCCSQKSIKHVHQQDTSSDDSSVAGNDGEFFIDMVEASNTNSSDEHHSSAPTSPPTSACTNVYTVGETKSDWSVTLDMNGTNVSFKIDTGAQCNVIPKRLLYNLSPRPKLKPASVKLSAYNGTPRVKHRGQIIPILFVVVDSDSVPLLGLNTCDKLHLIKQVYEISEDVQCHSSIEEEFSDCFGEIGCLKKTHHIELRDDIKPVVIPVRKVAFALKPKLKEELQRMVDLNVIEPVEKPTEWVNALVIVSKPNGKLRICLDPRPLNKAIKKQHHHLPTTEEIISEMSGARYFSKLDAASGYWQIKVDDESADLLTFGTPFGRYRFKRLPFGIHSASEVFQVEIASIIADIPGCANSQDDIIVWGTTKQEHDHRLRECYMNSIQWAEAQPKQMCLRCRISYIFGTYSVS